MKARELEYRDADGVVLQNGDWLLNPHTDDIAQLDIKRKKLFYYDGSSADLRRAGLGSWWHRVEADQVEPYLKLNQDREAQQAELKRLIRNLQK